MATASRQHLPPCCHGVVLTKKDTTKVRFKTELTRFAVPSAKKDALPRLAAALTDARSALQLDRGGADSSSSSLAGRFNTMDDIQNYVKSVTEYLSLVKGFTVVPASLVSNAQPPLLSAAQPNPVATLSAEGSGTPQAALLQPLIDTAATGVDMKASRSRCLGFCNWRDVLTNASAYAPNARLETAQVLLGSGLNMVNEARARVDTMLAERLTEIPENELKISYQLLLHAAGVFDACLVALDRTPESIGAENSTSTNQNEPDATVKQEDVAVDQGDALEKWREEQRRANDPSAPSAPSQSEVTAPSRGQSSSTHEDFAMLSRIPDLANGRFPQFLAWISLAQAQELVILRGISRDFVDYALMAKLSIDVALRYRQAQALASKHLPCSVSPVAEKLRCYCAFKDAYYTAVSCYFQGAACMETEDARNCAQAIANFKKAATLIQVSNQRKAAYDARADKQEKDRLFSIKTVYVRAEQIIQRDLDIVTRRNDAIYYERIPEPEPTSEPLSLVRAVEFPAVETHVLWYDADINTCLQATDPRAAAAAAAAATTGTSRATTSGAASGNTQEGAGPRREGCCESCIIS